MEPSFLANPYVQASAPSSHRIREILDREESSYVTWRKSRKAVRLPHASTKLNNPLQGMIGHHIDPSQGKSSMMAITCDNGVGTSSDVADRGKPRSRPVINATMALPSQDSKRKGALITGGISRSLESFPSLAVDQDARLKQVQYSQRPSLPNKSLDRTIIPPGRVVRRRFQQYLYDFHSRQVYSFAKSEVEVLEDAVKLEKSNSLLTFGDPVDDTTDTTSDNGSSARLGSSSENELRQEFYERQHGCLISGLAFLSPADYDTIFETDWGLSEAEKTVRDAVDRKRIREVLKRAYRMLLWFFRYYAGNGAYTAASEHRSGASSVTSLPLGEGLFEIPSQVRLLEDLNVQCIDAARFGVTDSPLKREGLIDFLLNVARMTCTHPSHPNHLRMVVNEGIEMSDAVKTLVHDHFGVFAQIQDVDHFRVLFLQKPYERSVVSRRLHVIIEIHKLNLAHVFDELVSTVAVSRSGGSQEKSKAQQRERGNGILCTQFISMLRAINLIIGKRTTATTEVKIDEETSGSGPNGVDEVRAVRIFLSCLPMSEIREIEVGAGINFIDPRELTLPQFIEALLRVAFTWKELQICHGVFDVCPNQMTSDCCQCASSYYDLDTFDDAVEEIFTRIHAYLLRRAQHRTSMRLKSMGMRSHRTLHSLVAMTTAQKPLTRVLPVDAEIPSYDIGE